MRWRDLSQVERVERYTEWSLYPLYWFMLGLGWVNALGDVDDHGVLRRLGIGLALLVLGGTAFMRRVLAAYPTPTRPWLSLGILVVGGAVVGLAASGEDRPGRAAAAFAVIAAISWPAATVAGTTWRWVLIAACALVAAVVGAHPLTVGSAVLIAGFFVFAVQVSLWLLDVVRQLDRARTAESALAVAEERLRFAGDVHDVLGRRLSMIAVQAELAGALADRGDPRAAERIHEVRATAHEGLREAREVARGYRPVDLEQELQGALSLLRSAGIAVEADVDGVPPEWQESAARTIREAVTNLLRHSRARTVSIRYQHPELVVRNDGVIPGAASGGGGLRALAEHLALEGGRLLAQREGGEFVVRARWGDGATSGRGSP